MATSKKIYANDPQNNSCVSFVKTLLGKAKILPLSVLITEQHGQARDSHWPMALVRQDADTEACESVRLRLHFSLLLKHRLTV